MADASSQPDALLGSQIGDYRILAVLGAGTMGIVYAAEHVTLGHRTACKVLRPEIMQQTDAVERFRQEVRQVSQIRHNNLVDIFDIGELPDGRLYYVMEYLAGQPLTEVLTQGSLGFSDIISLGRQVCAGLSAAHAAGLVHRDLSSLTNPTEKSVERHPGKGRGTKNWGPSFRGTPHLKIIAPD